MQASPTLQFLGAAGTVTGSKHLVRAGGRSVLLDCGLFQGLKKLRLRNWQQLPFEAATIDAVLVSHAHIDHYGYLPLLVRHGFRGPILCTAATADLLPVLLRDAAHLQEEDAEHANRHGYSRHRPALPLFTGADAEAALRLVQPRRFGQLFPVTEGFTAVFRHAGHILGSATIELQIGGAAPCRLVYSGDLGRWDRPILRNPELVTEADIVLVESTYGDRVHTGNPEEELARIVTKAVGRGGALLVPAFAVDRTQELLWFLRRLEEAKRIPTLPVYIDSPMAIDVTAIYARHPEEHNLDMAALVQQHRSPLRCTDQHLARTPEESKAINHLKGPVIIISASGMATGGRVLHHLEHRLSDHRTTVLLVGYQAVGTRGRSLQEGGRQSACTATRFQCGLTSRHWTACRRMRIARKSSVGCPASASRPRTCTWFMVNRSRHSASRRPCRRACTGKRRWPKTTRLSNWRDGLCWIREEDLALTTESRQPATEQQQRMVQQQTAPDFLDPAVEWRRIFAETWGTFLLVVVAAGGGVVAAKSGGAVTPAMIAVAPGILVMAIIYFMGAVSGAHLNPAVTLAFATRRNFPWRRVPGYLMAQFAGGLAAAGFLRVMFGTAGRFGATVPGSGMGACGPSPWKCC